MDIYHEKIEKKITIGRKRYTKFTKLKLFENSWHKNVEICKFTDGNINVIINNKRYITSPGDIIVINSGEIHHFEGKTENSFFDICTFDPLILYNSGMDLNTIKTHIKYNELKEAGIEKEISACFDNLFKETKNYDSSASIIMQSNLLKIYGLLLRHFDNNNILKANLSKRIAFQNIVEYISNNFSEKITLESLSERFNYSPVYISSAFASCTGVNFKYYLDNIRISKAIKMLTETKMSISEVADYCGFENIRTFNNVFKKIVGDTPKSIRNY